MAREKASPALFLLRKSKDLAIEQLRSIGQKCKERKPLDPVDQEYLADAVERILSSGERADRALGIAGPRGRTEETWLPRNIRMYERVEELRRQDRRRRLRSIYIQVRDEASGGQFDGPATSVESAEAANTS